jgi:dihydroxyacid dehydratase/phosphogluconate dehydratase
MGTRGMTYSLQSRDLIADQVETAAGGHHLDGMVVVPGCDKNMPGVLMARQYFYSVYSFALLLMSIYVKLEYSGTP